ncbi:hypothetical protein Tco_0497377 [Tanacetum coccineum]
MQMVLSLSMKMLSKPKITGRLRKWSIKLGEYDIQYRPRISVKGQILADFIVERPKDEPLAAPIERRRSTWLAQGDIFLISSSLLQVLSKDELKRKALTVEQLIGFRRENSCHSLGQDVVTFTQDADAKEVRLIQVQALDATFRLTSDKSIMYHLLNSAKMIEQEEKYGSKTSSWLVLVIALRVEEKALNPHLDLSRPSEISQHKKRKKDQIPRSKERLSSYERPHLVHGLPPRSASFKVAMLDPSPEFIDIRECYEDPGLPIVVELFHITGFLIGDSDRFCEGSTLFWLQELKVIILVGGEPHRAISFSHPVLAKEILSIECTYPPEVEKGKKADALSKITSTIFAHLTKQVLVKELSEKSIKEAEVLAIVEEEGNNLMTPINEYLTEETLIAERKKARAIRLKSRWYTVIDGVLYKKSFLEPWIRCVGPLQASYVIREIHKGSCSMHARPSSVVAKAIRIGYYWPTMHKDARKVMWE